MAPSKTFSNKKNPATAEASAHTTDLLWYPSHDLGIASEDECLALVDSFFPASCTPHTPLGRGDDCAELEVQGKLALSTDFFWQDTHFRTCYFTPFEAGAKALAVSVSDLAAAGAKPLGFSLGLMLPSGFSLSPLAGLLEGMASEAQRTGISLTGGDISTSNRIGFCLTVWGQGSGPQHDFFLRRKQARPGDVLFLLGNCGLAKAGLLLLETQGRKAIARWPGVYQAHLTPHALVQEGILLASLARVHQADYPDQSCMSLMDVSDGLARDLPRLLGTYGANLTFGTHAIADELLHFATSTGISAEELFLAGGEDYALLGTCPPALWPAVKKQQALLLGEVTQYPGLFRHGTPLLIHGFDHFSASNNS